MSAFSLLAIFGIFRICEKIISSICTTILQPKTNYNTENFINPHHPRLVRCLGTGRSEKGTGVRT